MDCYILYTVLQVSLLLLIFVIICNHYAKYRPKQRNGENIKNLKNAKLMIES